MRLRQSQKGFTLIELLVVIAIIALLAAIVLTAVSGARKKARTAQRVTGLRQIATALELYFADNNYKYPATGNGLWRSECAGWGSYASDQVIPGLVPKYLPALPADPTMDKVNNTACFIYQSDNGTNYALLDYQVAEYTSQDYLSIHSFVDPARDNGPACDLIDGVAPWSWKLMNSDATAAVKCE